MAFDDRHDPRLDGTGADAFAASRVRSAARRAANRRRRRLIRRSGGLGLLLVALAVTLVVLSGPPATRARSDDHHARPRPGRAAGRTADQPGVWLAATSGPQPTIAVENAHPGSASWRLPGPAGDVGGLAYGSVRGYVSAPAVLPGQTERIYVSAPGSGWVVIRLFRIGWYGGAGGREMFVSRRLALTAQPPCSHQPSTGLTECDWHPTLSFRVPSALPSGAYIAKLTTPGGASDCLFVVRARRPQPLLAQLPTATYEAYNAWGGDSLYPGGRDKVGLTGTTQGVEVSYDRPYDSVTGAGQFFARDVAMVWFLERYGYPVSYTTSESVAADPEQVVGHRALVDFGHSEYWSQDEESAWSDALRRGTSLLFFGSDTMAWRVRFAPGTERSSAPGVPGHVIVAYKQDAAEDPDRAEPTGSFPGGGAQLTGSAYVGCITPRLARPGPPTYHYFAWRPAVPLGPSWLFAGTGVSAQARIAGIVGYELDERTALTPRGTRLVGYGVARCMSRTIPADPGDPVGGQGEDLAESTLYRAPSGAIVFNTGTLGWELGLEPVPSASPDAPRAPNPHLVAMTRNLLDHVLAAAPGG